MSSERESLRVKLIGNWGTSEQVCSEWERMSQGGLRWNDIQVTSSDEDIDFYVIVNFPAHGERFRAGRTIVLQMEPWCADPGQTWGVKTWGQWARPDPAAFLRVCTHDDGPNTAFWQLGSTYDELRLLAPTKTGDLASIISPKYFDPGHRRRVDFLRYLEQRNDDVVRVEMYAYNNPLGFTSWVGPHPPGYKDAALIPYRYFLGVENNREHNFITEKLWEPLLTETVCFYDGAPNAVDHVDPRAFIPIDLDDFDSAFEVMRTAILEDEWSRRIEYIRREKRKVLEHLQFFPRLERILRNELRFTHRPTDVEVVYHKYFADDLGDVMDRVCFVHSLTVGGDTAILEALVDSVQRSGLLDTLDRLFIVNVGDPIALPPRLAALGRKVRLINRTPDGSLGEKLTLDLVQNFSWFNPNASVLYLHTKGASHDRRYPQVDDWRELMSHFVIENHDDCLEALRSHDVVGCEFLAEPYPHFSGNFWWATAAHIARLGLIPGGDRHLAEAWLCSRPGARVRNLHSSGVNHYEERYERSRYAPED